MREETHVCDLKDNPIVRVSFNSNNETTVRFANGSQVKFLTEHDDIDNSEKQKQFFDLVEAATKSSNRKMPNSKSCDCKVVGVRARHVPSDSNNVAIGPVTQFTVNHDGDVFCNDNARHYTISAANAAQLLRVLQVSEEARVASKILKERG